MLQVPPKCRLTRMETERLVVRLEELLEELKLSDERTKTLEDLLRLCEEANLAEKEERLQVEKWLSEVEQACRAE